MRFLRFALEGTAYQYPVLLLELALAPRTFSKCMDAQWFGTSTGERRWICSPQVRRHSARCSSPCLTLRWNGTRWHRAGQQPGWIRFLRSRYCHWFYARTRRSELQTWQNCWWHHPGRSPSGRICYPRWTARCGTRSRSCGAFMCGCFGDIRGAERPAFSCARYALGGASTFYETFVCLKMGSVCEMVRSGSYWPGYLHLSDVLRFLQYRLDSGSLSSTLKVYVAAIASFHSPQGGQSIGRHWWWVFLRERGDCIPHAHLQSHPGA